MAGYIGSKASVVSSGAEHKKVFNITTTTTSLTGLVYTPTLVHVFHNGVRLVDGTDYTATTGTSITLTVAAENGDQVAVISYATFQTSDTVSASAGGTFGNSVTMSSGAVVNRTGNGTIIDLQAGATTVGSIGTFGGDLIIGTGDIGLYFYDGATSVIPWKISTNALSDNYSDLGHPSYRWKNLYLGGGVYLGGTGAANLLDDYEEGTWTPTLPNGGTVTPNGGYYVKIGASVTLTMQADFAPTNNGSIFRIGGIPFVNKTGASTYSVGSVGYSGVLNTSNWHGPLIEDNGGSYIYFQRNDGTTAPIYNSAFSGGTYNLILAVTYFTDA